MSGPYLRLCFGLLATMASSSLSAQTVEDRLLENHHWYIPTADARFPTLVAIPGCSGVSLNSPRTDEGRPGHRDDVLFRLHYPSTAKRLRDAGYAVLLVDVLGAEGIRNACSGEISAARIAQYITAAIEWAKTQRHVDPFRIFVLGWSMGGGGLVAWLSNPDITSASLRGAIAIYPGCDGKKSIEAEIPLLMLLGAADDIAEPSQCERLVAGSRSRSLITVRVYKGARHGFDVENAPEALDVGNGMTVGYQEYAADNAWQEILGFLRSNQ